MQEELSAVEVSLMNNKLTIKISQNLKFMSNSLSLEKIGKVTFVSICDKVQRIDESIKGLIFI